MPLLYTIIIEHVHFPAAGCAGDWGVGLLMEQPQRIETSGNDDIFWG
jgi:hypothetical protein